MPRIQPVPRELATPDRPVSTRRARQLGVPPHRLRTRRWTRLSHGFYLPGRVARLLWQHRAQMISGLYPDAALSLLTASALWLGESPALPLHITVPRSRTPPPRSWLRVTRTTLSSTDTRRRWSLTLTSPVRTAFDCARLLPILDAVAEVDALLHASLLTRRDLARYIAEHPRLKGVPQARRVLQLCDPAAESRMESRTRVLLVLAGIPAPEVNVTLTDAGGRFLGRVDLFWRDARFVVEYEGDHHRDPKQYRADLVRRYRLERAGYRVLPITAVDVYQHPERLIAAVRAELAERLAA